MLLDDDDIYAIETIEERRCARSLQIPHRPHQCHLHLPIPNAKASKHKLVFPYSAKPGKYRSSCGRAESREEQEIMCVRISGLRKKPPKKVKHRDIRDQTEELCPPFHPLSLQGYVWCLVAIRHTRGRVRGVLKSWRDE